MKAKVDPELCTGCGACEETCPEVFELPEGADVNPIFTTKASLRWDFAEALAFVAELYYSYDDNQVEYTSDPFGLNVYSRWADPHVLGLNILAQARY